MSQRKSGWFGPVAAVLFAATAAACYMDSTLTVQAYAPLARPVATLPPAAPSASLLSVPGNPPKHALSVDALSGLATWYGRVLEGHHTASGERFNMQAMTAAHKTLPFGTILRVIDLKTRQSVVVRVNDRGVLPDNHVIDLSYAAAKKLNIVKSGVAPVKLEVLALGHPQTQQP